MTTTTMMNLSHCVARTFFQRSSFLSSPCRSSARSFSFWVDQTDASGLSVASFSTSSTTSSDFDSGPGICQKIACIGTGKMAEAIIEPLTKTGLQPGSLISVFDVSTSSMQAAHENYGVQTCESIPEVLEGADLILCAVKPQNLTSRFFDEFQKANIRKDAIFLSIIAGKSIHFFQDALGMDKIVRSMPNTPATIGKGMTVWSCTQAVTTSERKKVREILSSFGQSMYVDDESFIDVATSISGSGPAYIFMLMESMVDAGVHMGFPRDKAMTLVYHTMLGSTLYAMESKEHPAILRNRVTSPSGTTASAIYELENGRFRTVIKDAMWACYRRSLEMGDMDSNVGPGRHQMQDPKIVLQTDQSEEGGDTFVIQTKRGEEL